MSTGDLVQIAEFLQLEEPVVVSTGFDYVDALLNEAEKRRGLGDYGALVCVEIGISSNQKITTMRQIERYAGDSVLRPYVSIDE